MSHFTAVKGAIDVAEKEVLVKALTVLGLNPEVAAAGETIKMGGHYIRTGYDKSNNNYAHIVVRSGSIRSAVGSDAGKMRSDTDLGFRETPEGNYEIVVDDYSLGSLKSHAFTLEVGGKIERIGLKQAVSYAYLREQAEKLGANVRMNGLEIAMQPAESESYLYESADTSAAQYVSI